MRCCTFTHCVGVESQQRQPLDSSQEHAHKYQMLHMQVCTHTHTGTHMRTQGTPTAIFVPSVGGGAAHVDSNCDGHVCCVCAMCACVCIVCLCRLLMCCCVCVPLCVFVTIFGLCVLCVLCAIECAFKCALCYVLRTVYKHTHTIAVPGPFPPVLSVSCYSW